MKILVVDDSKAMRLIIQRTLRQAGFTSHAVSEAASGAQALELLRSESFDLVLSDWNMPEMNGIELLSKAKTENLVSRFGFITSESSAATRDQATAAGASFLIAKPFTPESFQQTLRGVLPE